MRGDISADSWTQIFLQDELQTFLDSKHYGNRYMNIRKLIENFREFLYLFLRILQASLTKEISNFQPETTPCFEGVIV